MEDHIDRIITDLFAVGPYETKTKEGRPQIDIYLKIITFQDYGKCGGEIWADLSMPLTHFGNRAFKGHVGSLVAKK